MDKLFLTVLNMSLTGAFVIAAVMLARIPLKKAPKIISYCLWAVVGFRLICPFAIESAVSLIPFGAEPVSENILVTDADISFTGALIDSLRSPLDETIIRLDPNKIEINSANNPYGEGVDTRYLFGYEAQFILASYVYPFCFMAMFIYGIVSYMLLKRRMRTAVRVEGNIYETDNIESPFVLGVIKPKIYLPLSLADGELEYIILHERTHIMRHDHIVKFAAYFILCLHWFNPLAWVAFLLMGVDMEMSCDERVLKEMGGDTKHEYSRSLLSLATQRRVIGGSPLAFGEGGVKERVKNVLNFRKPSRVIIVAAVALVAVLSVGFAVNRAIDKNNFTIPYFSAGDLTLGYYIEDMDLSIWNQANTSEWDYMGQYGAFRINEEGRIDKFTIYVHAFTEGIWTMSGIEPSDRVVNKYVFHIPANINEVLERFGEGSERYDAPENSKNVLSYVRYEDKRAGIAVLVEFHKGNGQIAYVTAEGLPAVASRPTPAPTAVPLTDTVSIIIWKDDNGQLHYSLFDGNVIPAPSELSDDRVYTDIAGLNAALADYPQDSLGMAHIRHTMDITKDEAATITENIVLPSDNYSKSTGYYEFHITTLDEAQEIANAQYPDALDIEYLGDETISYTNPPAPVDCYIFEVHNPPGYPVPVGASNNGSFRVAVSKERGIFFTYSNGTWSAFTGLHEGSGATQNMTLDDVRAIAQKIGIDLTMGDLRDFIGTDVGSGIFVMQYYIENSDYMLIVGSVDMNTVAYADLIHATDGGPNASIDIRYYDVDKFIKDETKELVRPLPEIMGATQYSNEFQTFLDTWNLSGVIPKGLTMTAENQEQFIRYFQQFDNVERDYIMLLLQGISNGTATNEYDDRESGVYFSAHQFCLYDMNMDGVPELILKTGVDSAGTWYTVYTVVNGKLVDCGGFSGSHADLSADGLGNFIRYEAQMGVYDISVYILEGTTLVMKEIASGELDYNKNEDYPELEGYGYGNYDHYLEFKGIPTLILAPKG